MATNEGKAHADPTDSRVVSKVLRLLSEWGWHAGLEQLRQSGAKETDPAQRGTFMLLIGWLSGERGLFDQAQQELALLEKVPELEGWVKLGQAYIALAQQQDFGRVQQLLDTIPEALSSSDLVLRASMAHCRGTCWHHQAEPDRALEELFRALELIGPKHLLTGRILDTLGMIYAARHAFALAHDFYEQALKVKEACADQAGRAVTHGQLGRLYLDWGELELAEEQFKKDLELALAIRDQRGAALMYNQLGRACLEQGRLGEAQAYLDESVRRHNAGAWQVGEAFARKDRALALLRDGQLERAEEDLHAAEQLFQHPEGKMHVDFVRGCWLRARGDLDAAIEVFRELAPRFHAMGELAEAARIQLELARTLGRRGVSPTVITPDLQLALTWAELSQRDQLIRQIEQELATVHPAEYTRWLYHRARGGDVRADTSSLRVGQGEEASVLFLDLCESTIYQHHEDASVVLATINQIFAHMAEPLKRHRIIVNQYLGDGFMALVRGASHARRSVLAALDLYAIMAQFNRPRCVLDLRPFRIRIGISTGYVCFGNVGTYQKIDFTAVGRTTNLAARLQKYARDARPCVSEETYRRLRDAFAWEGPEVVRPDGFPEQRVWFALRLKDDPEAAGGTP